MNKDDLSRQLDNFTVTYGYRPKWAFLHPVAIYRIFGSNLFPPIRFMGVSIKVDSWADPEMVYIPRKEWIANFIMLRRTLRKNHNLLLRKTIRLSTQE